MYYWLWCMLAMLFSALAEITLGQFGVPVPVLVIVAFYFAVLGPWYKCGLPLILGAALVDGLLPYSVPACGMTILVQLILAVFWRYLGAGGSIVFTACPGCLLGLLYGMLRVLSAGFPRTSVRIILIMAFEGAVLTPLAFFLLEKTGQFMAFRRMARIGMNYADEYYLEEKEAGDE